MIAIIDYGVGNLFSLCCSLAHMGIESVVTGDPAALRQADRLILPGVGAFGDAAAHFRRSGLEEPLQEQVNLGKPLLGICVGMQLLFQRSYEFGVHEGLGYLEGSIHSLAEDIPSGQALEQALGQAPAHGLKVPQMGWNSLRLVKPGDDLLNYTRDGEYVYYVHSYYAKDCEDCVVAWSDYGVPVPGIVHKGNVWGTQFHPEKSGQTGLNLLKAFSEVKMGQGRVFDNK